MRFAVIVCIGYRRLRTHRLRPKQVISRGRRVRHRFRQRIRPRRHRRRKSS